MVKDWRLAKIGIVDVTPQGNLLHERPNLCVLADFPAEGSFVEEPLTGCAMNSDINSTSLKSGYTSDGFGNGLISSSEGSHSSDQSSGNGDNPNSGHLMHGESSDEVDYL